MDQFYMVAARWQQVPSQPLLHRCGFQATPEEASSYLKAKNLRGPHHSANKLRPHFTDRRHGYEVSCVVGYLQNTGEQLFHKTLI
jgi:hypothetical protein